MHNLGHQEKRVERLARTVKVQALPFQQDFGIRDVGNNGCAQNGHTCKIGLSRFVWGMLPHVSTGRFAVRCRPALKNGFRVFASELPFNNRYGCLVRDYNILLFTYHVLHSICSVYYLLYTICIYKFMCIYIYILHSIIP